MSIYFFDFRFRWRFLPEFFFLVFVTYKITDPHELLVPVESFQKYDGHSYNIVYRDFRRIRAFGLLK